MKAISIRQPYAWLIVNGYKDVENRTWKTSHRGPLLIHAGLTLAENFADVWYYCQGRDIPLPESADIGGIVGIVEVVDVVTFSESPWFSGPVGFVLANARSLPPYELRGRQGVWETGLTLEDLEQEQQREKGEANAKN